MPTSPGTGLTVSDLAHPWLAARGGLWRKIHRPLRCAIVAIAAAAVLACQPLVGSDAVQEVRWGASFNMCVGYCIQELRVTPSTVRLVESSWQPAQWPERVSTQSFARAAWDHLSAGIRASGFYGLQATYGCPDCADGGAEWVETEGLRPKRVTFEYGANPQALDSVVAQLRMLADFIRPCPEGQYCQYASQAEIAGPRWTEPHAAHVMPR